MPNLEVEVREKLTMSDDGLLSAIGADLVGKQAMPALPSELSERAQRWLAAHRKRIEDTICDSEQLMLLVQGKNDNLEIAIEIVNLLVSMVLPVNPVTLAVLLTKRGLKSICATRWATNHE